MKRFTLIALAMMASLVLGACDAMSTPAPTTLSEEEQVALIAQAVEKAVQTAQAPTASPTASPTPDGEEMQVPPTETPVPTFTPTMSGTETAQANTPASQTDELMSVCDFTTADAKTATGVDVQRISTEPCGWTWRAVPKASVQAICPDNMVCTFDLGDKVIVAKGDGVDYSIVAGTWRLVSAYPLTDAVRDVCRLLKKEQANGAREIPAFEVFAGNFTCP